MFGQHEPGMARVEAISAWTKNYLTYVTGASHSRWTALDSFTSGIGVCRDFAHLTIAMLRACGIPARLVAVYAPGLTPMDFHAWVEVYVGARWWTFDPRHNARRKGHVVIARGPEGLGLELCQLVAHAGGLFEVHGVRRGLHLARQAADHGGLIAGARGVDQPRGVLPVRRNRLVRRAQ